LSTLKLDDLKDKVLIAAGLTGTNRSKILV